MERYLRFKPIYIVHLIVPMILIHLNVHIKMGVSATCCCCSQINSSFSLDKNSTYKDTFISVMYSPIITPILYITKPLLERYIQKNNVELYQDANIFFYAVFCLDNQKREKEIYSNKPVNHADAYDFSYLYLFVSLNIVISYFLWVYIFTNFIKNKKIKYILFGILILLLPYMIFMYIASIFSIDSVSYLEYVEKYSQYKADNFVLP